MTVIVIAYGVGIVMIVVLIWLYQLWQSRRVRRMVAHLPGPPNFPFIGSSLEFAGSNADIMSKIIELPGRYPSPFIIWLGNTATIIVTDPSDIQILLNNSKGLNRHKVYRFLKPILGDGLFTAAMPLWKKQRKIIMPTFNQKVLDTFVEIFVAHCDTLIEQLKKEVGKGSFDVFRYVSACTVDSVCETTMGVKMNAQLQRSPFLFWINSGLEIATKRMLQVWLSIDFIFKMTKYAKEEEYVVTKARCFVENVIKQKKKEYARQKKEESVIDVSSDEAPRCKSTLDLMMQLSENGIMFTNEDIRDQVNTIIAAGSDTTASTIAFVLMLLAMNPDCQEKLYEEVIDVLGPDRSLCHTDLRNLAYTERVIKETLRLLPAGPLVSRTADEDIHLNNCIVPATSTFVVPILELHRNPDIYPDPLKFDPDRFLPETVARRHPYTWIPFAGGPRNCLGINYAMMQMKVITACLIRKYKFKTEYKSVESIPISCSLIIKATHGYFVSLELRE